MLRLTSTVTCDGCGKILTYNGVWASSVVRRNGCRRIEIREEPRLTRICMPAISNAHIRF